MGRESDDLTIPLSGASPLAHALVLYLLRRLGAQASVSMDVLNQLSAREEVFIEIDPAGYRIRLKVGARQSPAASPVVDLRPPWSPGVAAPPPPSKDEVNPWIRENTWIRENLGTFDGTETVYRDPVYIEPKRLTPGQEWWRNPNRTSSASLKPSNLDPDEPKPRERKARAWPDSRFAGIKGREPVDSE